jgi:hypothetical protein
MSVARFAIALLAMPLLLTLQAEVAAAAPPSNDTFAGATPAVLGFSDEFDTSEATTDADDAQLNAVCNKPATDASVWYAFTTAVDTEVVVDVSQSSYSAGLLVGTGTQGSLVTFACGSGSVQFSATAGTTYYVLAVDEQLDGVNGGTLRISFSEPPPPTTVDITVDPVATFNAHTGVATITGTYSCSNGNFIDLLGEARQEIRPSTIVVASFRFFAAGTCDGTTRSWSAFADPESGSFIGGKAMTLTLAQSCGDLGCDVAFEARTVMLRGGSS